MSNERDGTNVEVEADKTNTGNNWFDDAYCAEAVKRVVNRAGNISKFLPNSETMLLCAAKLLAQERAAKEAEAVAAAAEAKVAAEAAEAAAKAQAEAAAEEAASIAKEKDARICTLQSEIESLRRYLYSINPAVTEHPILKRDYDGLNRLYTQAHAHSIKQDAKICTLQSEVDSLQAKMEKLRAICAEC